MTPIRPSYVPLYEQIKKALLERIEAGEWGPGSFLPSEMELASEYGVSQGTLRKALTTLVQENRVVRYQGKGTSVAVLDEDSSLFPFFLLYDKQGKRVFPCSQVYSVQENVPSDKECAALQIDAQTSVLHIKRIRMLRGVAVVNETITLPTTRFKTADFTPDKIPNALYKYYQQLAGIVVVRATEQIESCVASTMDVKHLHVAAHHPLLLVVRTSYDLLGQPVELRTSKIDTQECVYRTDLR